MSATVTIRDESTLEKTIHEFELEIPAERVSLRELIRCRVFQEVKTTTQSNRSTRQWNFLVLFNQRKSNWY